MPDCASDVTLEELGQTVVVSCTAGAGMEVQLTLAGDGPLSVMRYDPAADTLYAVERHRQVKTLHFRQGNGGTYGVFSACPVPNPFS